MCAKTRVVSAVKAKSMNRSQSLDAYLKLDLGETLWNNRPQHSLILSIIKQCGPDSAPLGMLLCAVPGFGDVACDNQGLTIVAPALWTSVTLCIPAALLSLSRPGHWAHRFGGDRSGDTARGEGPRGRAPTRWRPKAAASGADLAARWTPAPATPRSGVFNSFQHFYIVMTQINCWQP